MHGRATIGGKRWTVMTGGPRQCVEEAMGGGGRLAGEIKRAEKGLEMKRMVGEEKR